MDLALLLLRLVVGGLVAGHGAQKLFGWFGGIGFRGTTEWLASMRLRPALVWALLAGLVELGGGVLFVLGLLSPLGSLGIGASMLMAIAKVHWPRIWAGEGGLELPLVNLVVVAAVAITGPGRFSLDAALGSALPREALLFGPAIVVVAWLIGVITSAPDPAEARAGRAIPQGRRVRGPRGFQP